MSSIISSRYAAMQSLVAKARAMNRQWIGHKMRGEYRFDGLRNRRDAFMREARTACAPVSP